MTYAKGLPGNYRFNLHSYRCISIVPNEKERKKERNARLYGEGSSTVNNKRLQTTQACIRLALHGP